MEAKKTYILVTSSGETDYIGLRLPDAVDSERLIICAPQDVVDFIDERLQKGEQPYTIISCPIVGEQLIHEFDKRGLTSTYINTPSLPASHYKGLVDNFAARAGETFLPVTDKKALIAKVITDLQQCGYKLSAQEIIFNGAGASPSVV